ncbi:2092_t:CDS:2 [Scutellospora calospora]|uniref:2092_t:CDS:1 n=1 Tax=Scutellospora calospora TaxID=85575 RepID=A0ACA9K3H8_9GLOM|nr:2092_t:CDS:2 [Scutellospora calospora]
MQISQDIIANSDEQLSTSYDIVNKIRQKCEESRNNEKICREFINLMIFSAEPVIKFLQRQEENERDFVMIEQFKISLLNCKTFVESITQINGSIRYKDATSIRERFRLVMNDYWTCMKNLRLNSNYSTMINIKEQRKIVEDYLINDEIEDRNEYLMKDKNLNRGIFICKRGIDPKRSKLKFDIYPKFNPLIMNNNAGNFHAKFTKHSNWISKFISNLFNDEPVNEVYLEIQYPICELIFSKENLKLPERLIQEVKDSLQDNNPYHKLIKVFEYYGHFIPKKVTLGHKLCRITYLARNSTLPEKKTQEIKYMSHEDFEKSKFENLWVQWEDLIESYGSENSYLLSKDNKTFEQNDLQEWATSCQNNINDLQIISWDELYPLYELLDGKLQQKVKSILGINDLSQNLIVNEKVLMSGVISIKDHYCRVNFTKELTSDNYQIFGKLITPNGESINTALKFKSMTKRGFSVIIDIDETESIYLNSKIYWIMIGLPEFGYYSQNSRGISVLASGNHKFTYICDKQFEDILLQVPEDLPIGSVICATLKYLTDCGPTYIITIDEDYMIKISIRDSDRIEGNGSSDNFESEIDEHSDNDENLIIERVESYEEVIIEYCESSVDDVTIEHSDSDGYVEIINEEDSYSSSESETSELYNNIESSPKSIEVILQWCVLSKYQEIIVDNCEYEFSGLKFGLDLIGMKISEEGNKICILNSFFHNYDEF